MNGETAEERAAGAKAPVRSRARAFFRACALAFFRALGALLLVVGAFWLSDLFVILAMHGASVRSAHGLIAALGAASIVAVLLALVATPVNVLLPAPPGPTVLARVRGWLAEGDAEMRRARATEAVAWLGLSGVFCAALFVMESQILERVVTDRFRAVTTALGALGLSVIVLSLRRQAIRVATLLLSPLRRIPRLGRLFDTPNRALGTLVGVALIGIAIFLALGWAVYRALPWLVVSRLAGAALAGLGLFWLSRRLWDRARRSRIVTLGAAAALLLASVLTAFLLEPDAYTVRRIASEDTLSGEIAYGSLRYAFDFDHDGYLAVLGDGDCKELSSSIHPAAIDIPDNHVDENCDGSDATFTALGAQAWSVPLPEEAPHDPPVVLITIDGASPYHLDIGGPGGGSDPEDRADTPNIRAWAESGLAFDYAFVEGPSTRLSFPSLFTSRWDSELERSRAPRLPHAFSCEHCRLATLVQEAGYDTVAVASDVYFSRARWSSLLQGFATVDENAIGHGTHNAEEVTERAIEHIREERDRPLFLWVHYYDAHQPFTRVEGDTVQADSPLELHHRELAFIDQHIQPLFDEIEEKLPEALVILTADHGTVFRAPTDRRRGAYGYDLDTAALHVPMLVHAPWIAPRRSDALVASLDVVPTILNALRVEDEDIVLRGQSLFRHVTNGDAPEEGRMLFHQFFLPEKAIRGEDALEQVSVRTDRYNLIFNRKAARWEMYDWQADYFEQDDLLDIHPPPAERGPLTRTLEGFVYAIYEEP